MAAARRISLLLLLGAALSLAVAWGCALWSPVSVRWATQHYDGGKSIVGGLVPRAWPRPGADPARHVSHSCRSVGGPGLRYYGVECYDLPGTVWDGPVWPVGSLTVCRAGWPLAVLECHDTGVAPPAGTNAPWSPIRWVGGAPAPSWLRAEVETNTLSMMSALIRSATPRIPRPIPYRPRPLALLANATLYALALHLLLFHASAARARLRLRRNLCPNCRYPIGVSPVCTECGALLPIRINGNHGAAIGQ